jgi:hypothetical protein
MHAGLWLTLTVLLYFNKSIQRHIYLTASLTPLSYLAWAVLLSLLYEVRMLVVGSHRCAMVWLG